MLCYGMLWYAMLIKLCYAMCCYNIRIMIIIIIASITASIVDVAGRQDAERRAPRVGPLL